ncbi:hypothetical protein [Roseimaritima multifibrata]|nr:hypothetical protein [Roseimaritima multifibrata]
MHKFNLNSHGLSFGLIQITSASMVRGVHTQPYEMTGKLVLEMR